MPKIGLINARTAITASNKVEIYIDTSVYIPESDLIGARNAGKHLFNLVNSPLTCEHIQVSTLLILSFSTYLLLIPNSSSNNIVSMFLMGFLIYNKILLF